MTSWAANAPLRSIYNSLGGPAAAEAKVRRIMADFYSKMARDLLVGFFFAKKDLHQIASQQSQFLLYAMGHFETFTGKPPTQAHTDLPPILTGHFDRRIKILEETLLAHSLPQSTIEKWIGFERSFRKALTKRNSPS